MSTRLLADASGGFDVIALLADASGPGLVVLVLLAIASVLVWVIWIAKWLQLTRLQAAQRRFERACNQTTHAEELNEIARSMSGAPGASVIRSLFARVDDPALTQELLAAVASRAVTSEEQRASALMPSLSSIASASPFLGLFGTVWGIMIAFQRIGQEKSASLPVVAPAIGEALVATAIGLLAAIPATIAYNYLDRRIGDLMDELSAASSVWVARVFATEAQRRAASPERRGA